MKPVISKDRLDLKSVRAFSPKAQLSPSSGRPLSVVPRFLAELQFDRQNPRKHSRRQIRQIARSIEAFGFNVPVLIDARGHLIAGHGRALAAKFLGLTHVPTITLEHLTETQIRAFMIADNRLTENSVWDDRMLAEQLKTLSVLDLDFSVDVTGFEMAEIKMRIEELAPASRGKGDPADAIPDPGPRLQVTRTGDLWVLGRHRVYCGDARSDSAYSLLMEGRRARIVFTDAPCNGAADSSVTGLKKAGPRATGVNETEFVAYLENVLARLAHNTVDGALHFLCMDWQHSGELIAASRSADMEFKDLCVWVRDDAEQGSLYRSQHELVFVFRNCKMPNGDNLQLHQHDPHRSNVWRYRRASALSRKGREGKQSAFPAAIKPAALVADAILDGTGQGDIVLDPFLGSGTTVVAAERTGRTCYGLELDPRYVDLIVRRWQSFTSQNALQESTGRTFQQVEQEQESHGRSE
jgi:DNA modification methylase